MRIEGHKRRAYYQNGDCVSDECDLELAGHRKHLPLGERPQLYIKIYFGDHSEENWKFWDEKTVQAS